MSLTLSKQATGEIDEPQAAPAGDLTASRWQPAAAFAALLLLAFAYHASYLTARWWISDESGYMVAVQMVRDGRSPYDHPPYLGTPAFACACAWAAGWIGLHPVAFTIRVLNVVATAVVAWIASGWVRSTPHIRIATAVLVLFVASPLLDALGAGNISPIVNALTLIVLLSWRRHPVAAGLALGCLSRQQSGCFQGWRLRQLVCAAADARALCRALGTNHACPSHRSADGRGRVPGRPARLSLRTLAHAGAA